MPRTAPRPPVHTLWALVTGLNYDQGRLSSVQVSLWHGNNLRPLAVLLAQQRHRSIDVEDVVEVGYDRWTGRSLYRARLGDLHPNQLIADQLCDIDQIEGYEPTDSTGEKRS